MENLTSVLDRLTSREQKCLVGILNNYGGFNVKMTIGNLPFTNRQRCLDALNSAILNGGDGLSNKTLTVWHSCLAKLTNDGSTANSVFQVYMDSLLVRKFWKHVGENNYEHVLPMSVKREVGLRWQEFGKIYVRDEVSLKAIVRAKQLKGELFEISSPLKNVEPVLNYLFDKFGIH